MGGRTDRQLQTELNKLCLRNKSVLRGVLFRCYMDCLVSFVSCVTAVTVSSIFPFRLIQ